MNELTAPSFATLQDARVAIVLATLDLGGAERQALHLASYLQDECGANVAVVALFGGMGSQPIRQMCIDRRLPCLRVNMPDHDGAVPTFRSIRQFARDIAFLKPDLLLPYTALPNVLCGIVWQKVGAKACIWNQRDEGRELTLNQWHDLALKNASHFISNSREGTEYLTSVRGVPLEKVDLVMNGVTLPAPKIDRAIAREKWGLPPSGLVAVMLANIHQHKDHPTLVRAWKIVCDRLQGMHPVLVLAGREDDANALKLLIASLRLQKQIRMAGPVNDVSDLLNAADLAVFSSWREGTPNAVIESMAAGRAVVATDIPGCRDALGDNYPALAPRQNAESMAEKIIELALDETRRAKLGATLAQRAATEFSVVRMCEKTCDIIRSVLH